MPRKLGIKPGQRVAVVNPPSGFTLGPLPGVSLQHGLDAPGELDVILTFLRWQADLRTQLGPLRGRLAPAGGLWIAWPKRAARQPGDMTEDAVREVTIAKLATQRAAFDVNQ